MNGPTVTLKVKVEIDGGWLRCLAGRRTGKLRLDTAKIFWCTLNGVRLFLSFHLYLCYRNTTDTRSKCVFVGKYSQGRVHKEAADPIQYTPAVAGGLGHSKCKGDTGLASLQ